MRADPAVESQVRADWLRGEARRLGFFKTGIARAQPLPGREKFDEWLRCGLHGEMRWMERQADKRRDPSLILPDVRSIVALAMNYYSGAEPPRRALAGMISRYARGDDYHTIVGNRLSRLLRSTERRFPGTRGLWYVDTGPVSEKAWASA